MRTKHWLPMFLLATLLAPLALPTTPAPIARAATHVQSDWGQMPLHFVANQGQLDARVAYYVPGSDKTLYFTPTGVTLALANPSPALSRNHADSPAVRSHQAEAGESGRWIVKLDFAGEPGVSHRARPDPHSDLVLSGRA